MSKYVGFRLGKVHESHVISEYYCGGCGYPVTDHDSFCPECGGAVRECEASNLKAENAKLRELVWDMRTCIDHACMCEFCPLFVSEDMNERRCIADMRARMRELGLEVE